LSPRRRVLVTGASGVIGVEVAAELARAGDHVLAMLHRNQELVRNSRQPLKVKAGHLEGVVGDITRPRFGLSTGDYDRLQSSVDLIIHSAAVTEFGRPPMLYAAVNEQGTQHVLDLAERTRGGAIPVIHVSTAYVCGDRRGIILENELEAEQHFANAYEQSKLKAEILVRAATGRGVPTAIVRPSIVVGSGRTGATRDFKNVYVLLKVLVEGRIGVVPGDYDAVLDLVPIDYVASMVVSIAQRMDEATGHTFHLVGDTPITLRDCSDVLAEYPPFSVPRVVPPQSFDKDRLTSIERGYYEKIVRLFEPYLTRRVLFSAVEARRFSSAHHPPSCKTLLRRLLNYCIQRGYLGSPLTPVGSVLDALAAAD
jgi:thioester reductase-like protein